MISVSDAVKTAYINGNADTELFLTIGLVEYDPTNILAGSVSIDESLCSAEQFDLSRVEKNQLTFTLFNISENISDLQGLTVVAKQRVYPDPSDHTTYTDIPLGTYEIVEAVNDGDYLFKCTCYDKAMLAFDTNIDAWWNTTVTFPVTLRTLATDLFDYLDVDYDIPTTFTNSTFSIVKRTVYFEGVTAAELLGYIQEVAGGYFKADRNGIISYYEAIPADEGLYPAVDLYPRDYLYPHNPHATAFGNPDTYQPQNYRFPQIVGDLEIADYWTAEIERVQVRGTEDDIGIIAGEGTNTYVIQGNPLLYNLTSETGATVVANILDAIDGVTYIPFKGRFMALPFLEVGDYAIIHTYKGLRVYSPIFARTLSGSKLCFDTLESKGSQEIEQVTHVERSLTTLNQKTHEIVNTVSELSSTVTSVDTELNGTGGIAETVSTHTTQIQQNANAISLKVSSYYQGTAPTTPAVGDLWVDTANNDKIKRWNGSTWDDAVDGNTIVSLINLDSSGVQISGSKVNIDTTTLNLTFGSGQSTVTIQSTTNQDGVLFTGEGKVEFETNGEFYAKNYDSSDNIANSLQLTTGSTTNSTYIRNRYNNITANILSFTTTSSNHSIWYYNYQIGESTANANNMVLEAGDSYYRSNIHNFNFENVNSTTGRGTLANKIELSSYASYNRINIDNDTIGDSSGNAKVANRINLYHSKSSYLNSLALNNYRQGTNERYANYVYLYASDTTYSASITNYNYEYLNSNSEPTNANNILLNSTSSTNTLGLYNRNQAGSSINSLWLSRGTTDNSVELVNRHTNANTANMLRLLSSSNSASVLLGNYDSSGNIRTSIIMSANGGFSITTTTGGTSFISIPGQGETGTGNLNVHANNDLNLSGSRIVVDSSHYGGGSNTSPSTGTGNPTMKNWDGNNIQLHFYKGIYLGYTTS